MAQQRTAQGDDTAAEYLPIGRVKARYSNVSDMTISRWMANPKVGFPRPVAFGGRYRFWKLTDLIEWERKRAAGKGAAA
jgi:predicted DNA-binding transcriptional regulator AlpA